MNFSVTIIGALIGAVVLLFGRKLFWLCVAAIGFAAGVELAPHLVHEPSALLSLTIALLLGIILFSSNISPKSTSAPPSSPAQTSGGAAR